jgi:hypothetical protein
LAHRARWQFLGQHEDEEEDEEEDQEEDEEAEAGDEGDEDAVDDEGGKRQAADDGAQGKDQVTNKAVLAVRSPEAVDGDCLLAVCLSLKQRAYGAATVRVVLSDQFFYEVPRPTATWVTPIGGTMTYNGDSGGIRIMSDEREGLEWPFALCSENECFRGGFFRLDSDAAMPSGFFRR